MGGELIRAVHANDVACSAAPLEHASSLALGQDVGRLPPGKLGVLITDDPIELFANIDAVLDFTVPAASVEFAALAATAPSFTCWAPRASAPPMKPSSGRRPSRDYIRSGNMSWASIC